MGCLSSFHLFSDLVCGVVEKGVCPQLPVHGITIIMGNDLAGSRVWKDCTPPVYASSPLHESKEPDECTKQFLQKLSSCAVTRARSKAKLDHSDVSEQIEFSQANLTVIQCLEWRTV